MAIQTGDLFVVNRAGTSYKLDYSALKTALEYTLPAATAAKIGGVKQGTNITIASDGTISANITGALVYKGTVAANAATAPAGATAGDTYILSSGGALSGTGWGAIGGTTVSAGDMLLFTGTVWDHVGSSGGGATGVTSISASANTGVSVTGGTSATPVIAGLDASTTAKGVVQLADATAITAGTSTALVVTVAQLDAAKAVYASSAETLAGTVTNKSVTPKGAKDTYLPLNFSTLVALP
jgi:antigen 43